MKRAHGKAEDRCPTCHRKLTRTHPQNARYWLLLHRIAEGVRPKVDGTATVFSAETWHTYFKGKFLGCDEHPLPNRHTLLVPRSTANLPVDEFNDYMTKVETWALEHNVWLDDIAA